MSNAERKAIEGQLKALASGSVQDEIKLCYVTVSDYFPLRSTNQVDFRVYVAREIGEESLFSENLTRLGKGRKIVTDSR